MVESQVEIGTYKYAEALGWKHRKLQWVGRRGAPDRLFWRGGKVIFIEFKDRHKDYEELQRRECQRMRDDGLKVYKIDTLQKGMELFDAYGS